MPPTFLLVVLAGLYIAGVLLVGTVSIVLTFIPSKRQFAGPIFAAYICSGMGVAVANVLALATMGSLVFLIAWLSRHLLHSTLPESALWILPFVLASLLATVLGGRWGWQVGWEGMIDQPRKKGSA